MYFFLILPQNLRGSDSKILEEQKSFIFLCHNVGCKITPSVLRACDEKYYSHVTLFLPSAVYSFETLK